MVSPAEETRHRRWGNYAIPMLAVTVCWAYRLEHRCSLIARVTSATCTSIVCSASSASTLPAGSSSSGSRERDRSQRELRSFAAE